MEFASPFFDWEKTLMAITKLDKVPLRYQYASGVCWFACSRMVYLWSQATGRGSMTDPRDDAGYFQRYNDNGSVGCDQNWHIAQQFNMKKHPSITMDCKSVDEFLKAHGPIWTGLQKNWGGYNHGHVVVICGVADTGVFIHDPEPINQGSTLWLTWDQIGKALNGLDAVPNPQFLSAA